ncbi:methyltransferase domain-containing protein [Rathayibacter sp. Leaf296]|uniref:methyltransferase domain-containing protein n=1 Tax=Rathayibacter sp. Leaf296 TaxID=1736327 RepID=UPI0009EB481E|nr:methyltransferase domain-containing protein [Rathayibacter sp. Leaf296]
MTALPAIGAPATRALAAVGIRTLEDLRGRDLTELAALHGVGPKAIRLLTEACASSSADVVASYSARADEYAELFGSMSSVHPSDERLVSSWARSVEGRLLDAGCGPGQWTAHLAGMGLDVSGVDGAPVFVELARRAHPDVPFAVGDLDALEEGEDSLGGVLAWYSLIHHRPSALPRALAEFARVLRPGGTLLVGFFTGSGVEPFDHAITTAYRWPPEALADELRAAGFEILETHTRTVQAPGPRPHGAVLARRSSGASARPPETTSSASSEPG